MQEYAGICILQYQICKYLVLYARICKKYEEICADYWIYWHAYAYILHMIAHCTILQHIICIFISIMACSAKAMWPRCDIT